MFSDIILPFGRLFINMNIYAEKMKKRRITIIKLQIILFGKRFPKRFFERRIKMAENYARENASEKSCKNCKKNAASDSVKTPMSKQNAAQRKTEDCEK